MSIKSMTNRKEELDRITDGEEIVAIGIGGDVYSNETLNDAFRRLEHEFDCDRDDHKGEVLRAWTEMDEYLCVVYDGSEWLKMEKQ